MTETKAVAKRPVDKLKEIIASPTVQEQFKNALSAHSDLFVASLIDIFASDTNLQACSPHLVVMEAFKAATLRLPINKNLGFAYIVPYQKSKKTAGGWVKESIPQFQLGYRGMIQLAQRSGIYRCIHADVVYEGELMGVNRLTGDIDLNGPRKSNTIVGFFAYLETTNGFQKTLYRSREEIEQHAQRYSKAFGNGPWKDNFEQMAIKTVLRQLLSKYGLLSVEMMNVADSLAQEEMATDMTPPVSMVSIPDAPEEKEMAELDHVGVEDDVPNDFPPPAWGDEALAQ